MLFARRSTKPKEVKKAKLSQKLNVPVPNAGENEVNLIFCFVYSLCCSVLYELCTVFSPFKFDFSFTFKLLGQVCFINRIYYTCIKNQEVEVL